MVDTLPGVRLYGPLGDRYTPADWKKLRRWEVRAPGANPCPHHDATKHGDTWSCDRCGEAIPEPVPGSRCTCPEHRDA